MLSVNPALKYGEVRDIFRRACDRIDPRGGNYDAAGHSLQYGFGRLNALTAVALAKPQPQSGITISRMVNATIPDLRTVSFTLVVPDNTPVRALTVSVDLKHTYIGDLIINLLPPAGLGVNTVVLHNRSGGSTRDLKKTYDAANVPALAGFSGKSCKGTWTLRIQDAATQDKGTLVSFALGLEFVQSR